MDGFFSTGLKVTACDVFLALPGGILGEGDGDDIDPRRRDREPSGSLGVLVRLLLRDLD